MILNLAFYGFGSIAAPEVLRDFLRQRASEVAPTMRGSILVGTEGINAMLSGDSESVDHFLEEIRKDPEINHALRHAWIKRSQTERVAFKRMIIKAKREIIPMGSAGGEQAINPVLHTGKRLPPEELKQWMDEGRPFHLIDTRNKYEVRLGTFKGALDFGIGNFRQFPKEFTRASSTLKKAPIVMFCTGGIRCEKATAFAQREGFEDVYQLDGGILGYFERCGGAHYEGECFVFDRRVAVDPELKPSLTRQCFACREPLTPEEQERSADCIHCGKNPTGEF